MHVCSIFPHSKKSHFYICILFPLILIPMEDIFYRKKKKERERERAKSLLTFITSVVFKSLVDKYK